MPVTLHRCWCGELHQKGFRHIRPRASASERGYGVAWRRVRDVYLSTNPDCMACGAPATDVDHVVSRARGGDDDESNLRALCHACHARKTARHDGGYGNVRKPMRGGL